MPSALSRLFNDPQPIRRLIRLAIRNARIGSPRFRSAIGAIERPNYAYLVFQAAQLAARLGHDRVSVIEFGVAGGTGLLALERHADWVETIFPVRIEIYGFDTGAGLPTPKDYRDLPYHWKPGFFRMDKSALAAKLRRSRLVLGDVAETSRTFIADFDPAPIGAVAHDLDFYSSTVDALSLFDVPERYLLPRIVCYFDDTIGGEIELYGDDTGERLAIREFNDRHADRKLSPVYYLRAAAFEPWHHQIWALHAFSHTQYGSFVSSENQQRPIPRRSGRQGPTVKT